MHLIRRFEEAAEDSYIKGKSYGTMHLSIGQEATAVGICAALSDRDYITSTHRGHGHCIATGAEVKRMFAEFLGREDGYCRGRGGSMHIADPARGNLGANGIVGGGLPIAVGAAFSAKRLKTGAVAAMAVEVILPRVDMDMRQARLTHWFAAEGESVARGQALFEIETDKAAMEVAAPAGGVLRGVAAEPGGTYPVGAVIGWICAADEVLAEAAATSPPAALRATPKARRLAREAGVELSALAGSGPHGRIQARDVTPRTGLHREWLARGERAPLVLIHGFGADLNVWRRWLGRLPPGRGALAFDLPGHGRSSLSGPVEIEAFAAAIADTLAREGVASAHLVAHSLGACAAAALAAMRPSLVRSLTLIAPAGFGPDINGAFVAGFLAARSAASLRPWLAELAVDAAMPGDALAETTMRQRRDLGVGEAQARIAAALPPDGAQVYSARAAVERFAGPVRLVFGREDRIVPVRHARHAPAHAAVHILANVGHMPHLEARDLVARLAQENAAAGDELSRL